MEHLLSLPNFCPYCGYSLKEELRRILIPEQSSSKTSRTVPEISELKKGKEPSPKSSPAFLHLVGLILLLLSVVCNWAVLYIGILRINYSPLDLFRRYESTMPINPSEVDTLKELLRAIIYDIFLLGICHWCFLWLSVIFALRSIIHSHSIIERQRSMLCYICCSTNISWSFLCINE